METESQTALTPVALDRHVVCKSCCVPKPVAQVGDVTRVCTQCAIALIEGLVRGTASEHVPEVGRA